MALRSVSASPSTSSHMGACGGGSVPTAASSRPNLGDAWTIDSETLLPPPPLHRFAADVKFKPWRDGTDEQRAWDGG